MNRFRVAALALALVGLGSAAAVITSQPRDELAAELLTATADVGSVRLEVVGTGVIERDGLFALAFGQPERRITEGDVSSTGGTTDSAVGVTDLPVPKVTTIQAAVGDVVVAGDILAAADTTDLVRALDIAKAYRYLARKEAATAEATATLYPTTANTLLSLQAQAEVARIRSEIGALEQTIAAMTLRAPVGGTIVSMAAVVGQPIPSADAIVVDSGSRGVTIQIPEADIAALSVGQPASVGVAALGMTLTGNVVTIGETVAAGGDTIVSFPVRIGLERAPSQLRAGMSAQVSITIASVAGVVTVPSTAIGGSSGGRWVAVLSADGTVATRGVTVGLVDDTVSEITSGLTAGEVVVTGTTSTATDGSTSGSSSESADEAGPRGGPFLEGGPRP